MPTRAEAAVSELESDRAQLLRMGRSAYGVVGRSEYGPLRAGLASSGVRITDAAVLGVVAGLGMSSVIGWTALASPISSSLGIATLSFLPIVALLGAAVAGLALLSVPGRTVARRRVAFAGGALACAGWVTAALASGSWTVWGLVPSALLGGASLGAAGVAHASLLWDIYRPEVRVRMFSVYAGGALATTGAAVLLMAVADSQSNLTWRTASAVLAVVSGLAALAALRTCDPEPNRWDQGRVESSVNVAAGEPDRVDDLGPVEGERESGWEKARRVIAVPSVPLLLVGIGAVGLLLVSLPNYFLVLLRDRFDVHDGAWLLGVALVAGCAGLPWLGRRGEVGFRITPARLVVAAAWACLVGGVAVAVTVLTPDLVLALVAMMLAIAGIVCVLPALTVALMAVVHPSCRAHAALIAGLATLWGAVVGQQIISSVAARFGVQWALVISGALLVGVAAAVSAPARTIGSDLDAVVGELVEAAELAVMVGKGRHLPLLRCHQVDFSYGQLQVLFGVNFTVDDGQMVALLGTNGAGKSTLLRAISGVGHVDRGTVHFRGADVTHLGADGRVRLGITQVAGGQAVFGAMTVVDNLRAFAYIHGRDTAMVTAGIDVCFETFPRLAERAGQLAATLSGGEQQMLGLTKAFLLRPRLLLIDELSLGLAPVIVADLLQMVRRINAEGTAVVLVEQSANIALSLVDHAYFMEKGQIRFDGRAQDLLARPDLLRSVFLEGAAKARR